MEEPWLLPIDPVRAFFVRVEEALVVHAAFAFTMASSASLSLTSVLYSRSPDIEVQRLAPGFASYGALSLMAAIALGLFACGLLLSGLRILTRVERAGWLDARPPLRFVRLALILGAVLLFVWAPFMYLLFAQGVHSTLVMLAVALGATANLILSAALFAPPFRLATVAGRIVAGLSAVLVVVAIAGEVLLGPRLLSPPSADIDWLTFGGVPPLHWHGPFGVMVGVGSILLWWSYRMIPRSAKTIPPSSSRAVGLPGDETLA